MDIALRATVIFVALYLLVRLMGKRELGQMTPFELIVLVVIGAERMWFASSAIASCSAGPAVLSTITWSRASSASRKSRSSMWIRVA